MPNKYEKYFKILDLDIGASKKDVKKAFRELSHIWHPDNHMGKSSNVQNRANEKFKEISNAYQVLKNYFSDGALKEVINALKNEDITFFKQRLNFLKSEIVKKKPIKYILRLAKFYTVK